MVKRLYIRNNDLDMYADNKSKRASNLFSIIFFVIFGTIFAIVFISFFFNAREFEFDFSFFLVPLVFFGIVIFGSVFGLIHYFSNKKAIELCLTKGTKKSATINRAMKRYNRSSYNGVAGYIIYFSFINDEGQNVNFINDLYNSVDDIFTPGKSVTVMAYGNMAVIDFKELYEQEAFNKTHENHEGYKKNEYVFDANRVRCECGNICDANLLYCPRCGRDLKLVAQKQEEKKDEVNKEVISFCPGCGRKIEEDVSFCPSCGRKLK